MTNYPAYNYGLLTKFVEGNVQNRIKILYEHINEFIQYNAPILEDIQQRLNIINSIPFGKLKRSIIENGLRSDYEGSKKSLNIYNRAFGKVDLYLGLMTSNFKLPQFLIENNIPKEEIIFFQKELQLYWQETYGYHIDHLERCVKILDTLRRILEEEVKLLEKIPQETYLSALEESELLRELFQQERNAFWELVETAELQQQEMETDSLEQYLQETQQPMYSINLRHLM